MLTRRFLSLGCFGILIFSPLTISHPLSHFSPISHAPVVFICCLHLSGNVKSNPFQVSCWSVNHLMYRFVLCHVFTPWHDAAECQYSVRASDVATYAPQLLLLGPWWSWGGKVMVMCWERETPTQHADLHEQVQQVASNRFVVSVGLQGRLRGWDVLKCVKGNVKCFLLLFFLCVPVRMSI